MAGLGGVVVVAVFLSQFTAALLLRASGVAVDVDRSGGLPVGPPGGLR